MSLFKRSRFLKEVLMKLTTVLRQAADELKDEASELTKAGQQPVGQRPAPVHRKVLLIIFNPPVPSEGRKFLNAVMKWNDPEELTEGHIADMKEVSYGYANYQVVGKEEVRDFPVKVDGFKYKADDFVKALRNKSGFHPKDEVNYLQIVKDHKLIERVNSGEIDEVWMHGFPYAGFYESIMAGPGAFWCNAPALKGTENAKRRFVIMGFNYQRGLGEMLENQGHRAESIMKHVFRNETGKDNLWEKFTRYDKTHPGKAEVGIVHYAPNSEKDYDWGNMKKVTSYADDWLNFPNFKGEKRTMDATDWGKGDTKQHHVWWFKRLPHITGSDEGISYNWWEYIIDPNKVK
jgi:hypothetical protein